MRIVDTVERTLYLGIERDLTYYVITNPAREPET